MKGKTILITGGSRGIGEAIVRLAATRYNVAFTYNSSEEKARALEKELGVFAVRCDVSSPQSVAEAVKAAEKSLGRIDMLVNNAGVAGQKLFQELTDQDWRDMFAVNIDGTFYVTRAVLPQMISRGQGSVVNVSSMWGQVGASLETCYSASKAAVIGLTKALAKEVAPSGITVNAVAPGAIDTDMMKGFSSSDVKSLCEEIPLGRLGTPTEIAEAVLFLLEAPYVTGQVLSVSGGFII